MRRLHAALLGVLLLGLTVGGTGVVGGVDAGGTNSAPVVAADGSVHAGATAQAGSCSYPVEVTDATGETVVLEEEPAEVVTLGASDAQVMWALNAEEKVTGLPVTPFTSYLPDRQTLPSGENRTDISGDFGPVVEKVVGLDPDLVLAASAMFPEDVQAIRDAGLTVYHAEDEQTLADVYGYIEQLGEFVGACDRAEAEVEEMQETVEFVEGAVSGEETPSVFYAQIPGEGWTAGSGTVEEDMIRTAGGENVGSELGVESYNQVSEESILSANPDYILRTAGPSELPESLSTTTAVKEEQILVVDGNALSQPGPRMVEPLVTIAEALHPEAVEAARNAANETGDGGTGEDGTGEDGTDDDGTDDDGTDDDGTGEDGADDDGTGEDGSMDGGDNQTSDGDDSADGDGTGLTVVAALVALSALAVVARQRAR